MIKNEKVIDFIISLVSNLFSGENNMELTDPKCRIYIGFLRIIDSILSTLHIDLGKLIKVAPDAVSLLAPLAYKGEFDAYNAELPVFDYVDEGSKRNIPETKDPFAEIPRSRKGPAIIITGLLCVIGFLPIILLLLLFGYINNQIKYGKKIKG